MPGHTNDAVAAFKIRRKRENQGRVRDRIEREDREAARRDAGNLSARREEYRKWPV